MYHYKATIDRVIDGDTVDATVDLGFQIKQKMRLRLHGINAPEVRGFNKEVGRESRAYLIRITDLFQPISIRTHKDKADSFGRYLARLYGADEEGVEVDLNQLMVDTGHAEVWKP